MEVYYTYLYSDPSRGEPIYVGKGKDDRVHDHLRLYTNRVRHPFINRLAKMKSEGIEPVITFICVGVENDLACLVEIEAIAKYGRKDLGLGSLLNLTDGGEGAPGSRHTPEAKEKMRLAALKRVNRPLTADHKAKLSKASKGSVHTEEARKKMSDARKIYLANNPEAKIPWNVGKKMSDEQRAKVSKSLSEKQKGKKQTLVECPHCGKIGGKQNMSRYHFKNCKKIKFEET